MDFKNKFNLLVIGFFIIMFSFVGCEKHEQSAQESSKIDEIKLKQPQQAPTRKKIDEEEQKLLEFHKTSGYTTAFEFIDSKGREEYEQSKNQTLVKKKTYYEFKSSYGFLDTKAKKITIYFSSGVLTPTNIKEIVQARLGSIFIDKNLMLKNGIDGYLYLSFQKDSDDYVIDAIRHISIQIEGVPISLQTNQKIEEWVQTMKFNEKGYSDEAGDWFGKITLHLNVYYSAYDDMVKWDIESTTPIMLIK